MIQRPQSILLAIVAILYAVIAFAPLWTITIEPSTVLLNATNATLTSTVGNEIVEEKSNSNVYLLAVCACGFILSIVTIFLFKNRPLQAKISAANTLIIAILLSLATFVAIPQAQELIMTQDQGSFEWGFYLTAAIIILNFLANKLIRKDEALVRSVDRIR